MDSGEVVENLLENQDQISKHSISCMKMATTNTVAANNDEIGNRLGRVTYTEMAVNSEKFL